MQKITGKKGFTLIEFVLATALFTFFLVMILLGFVQINRSYNRGNTVKEVQETARLLLEDISRSIQASNEAPTFHSPGSPASLEGFRLCAGSVQYSWNGLVGNNPTEEQYNGSSEIYSMVKSPRDNCTARPSKAQSSTVIDNDLRVQELSITPAVVGGNTIDSLLNIELVLSTIDDALINEGSANVDCDYNDGDREAAKQYCTVVRVNTSVSIRK